MLKKYDLEKEKVKYIEVDFSFLVDNYGFEVIESYASPSFGGQESIMLGSKKTNFSIRIIKERGIYFFDFVSNLFQIRRYVYFDWDITASYIKGYGKYVGEIIPSDKSIGDSKYQLLRAEEKLQDIGNSFDKIIEAFSWKNYRKTARVCRRYERQRGNSIFGTMSFGGYLRALVSWVYSVLFSKKK